MYEDPMSTLVAKPVWSLTVQQLCELLLTNMNKLTQTNDGEMLKKSLEEM